MDDCAQMEEVIEKLMRANAAASQLVIDERNEIRRLRAALKVYAAHGSWLIDNDGVMVNHVEWNVPGEDWSRPWLTAESALSGRK